MTVIPTNPGWWWEVLSDNAFRDFAVPANPG
jgi:hypothetical protein